MNRGLWIVQGLLAALFMFGGVVKLTMPAEELTAQTPFPVAFIHVISICEILGSLGLILPAVFRLYTGLVPLAAAGLTIIMVGAVVSTAIYMDLVSASIPFLVLVLVAFVAYGRWRLAPHGAGLRQQLSAAVRAS